MTPAPATKKWKIALLCYYQYFRNYQKPVTNHQLFQHNQSLLRKHGIVTERALREHAGRFTHRRYLHIIRDKTKSVYSPIPWMFLLSKAGLEKLRYEQLISHEESIQVMPIVYEVARRYGVAVKK